MPIEMIEEFDQGTQIKVIGVGGGGGNAVEHMITQGVQGVEFICANTDAQALNRSSAHSWCSWATGLGAGAKPEWASAAAEEAEDRIREAITGAHMLFITAGMGGGTGTGAAPVIARVAKEMGILTVGVVTKPFEFEGKRRGKQADDGVAELEANVDSLIVVLNEKLLEVMGDDVTQEQAFAHANDVLKNAVGGISDIIHIPGLVNVDFEDVKTVMSEPGKAMMGTARPAAPTAPPRPPSRRGLPAAGRHRPERRARRAGADRGQQGTFKLSREPQRDEHHPPLRADDAHVIYGTAYDEAWATSCA
jgi:cell division protein FtsZ